MHLPTSKKSTQALVAIRLMHCAWKSGICCCNSVCLWRQ